MLHEKDIIELNCPKELFCVVMVNDCRAACVALNGRDWRDPKLTIRDSEHGCGISPDSNIPKIGRLAGTLEEHVKVEVNLNPVKEVIYLPMPGTAPKAAVPHKLNRSRTKIEEIVDDELPPIFDLLIQAASSLQTTCLAMEDQTDHAQPSGPTT